MSELMIFWALVPGILLLAGRCSFLSCLLLCKSQRCGMLELEAALAPSTVLTWDLQSNDYQTSSGQGRTRRRGMSAHCSSNEMTGTQQRQQPGVPHSSSGALNRFSLPYWLTVCPAHIIPAPAPGLNSESHLKTRSGFFFHPGYLPHFIKLNESS